MTFSFTFRDFGNFDAFSLDPSPRISELALLALDEENSGWTEADGSKEELATFVENALVVSKFSFKLFRTVPCNN